MNILKNKINKFSDCQTNEDISDDDTKDMTDNCFMDRGEISTVR